VNKERVRKELTLCLKGGSNAEFFGMRALHHVKLDTDPGLVRGVLKRLVARGFPVLSTCRRLPDVFAPLLTAALMESHEPERTFFDAFVRGDAPLGPQVRSAGTWLFELQMVDDHKRGRERLTKLAAEPRAVDAARAVVAASGTKAPRYLAVLGHDGSEDSADVLLPLVLSAVEQRDERLDTLTKWLGPFVRGPRLAPVLEALRSATSQREGGSPLLPLLSQLGIEGPHFRAHVGLQSVEVKEGFLRRASLTVWLQSDELPHVRVAVSKYGRDLNPSGFAAADGKVTNQSLKLEPPSSPEAVPKWISETGRKLGVRWDTPRWLTLSVRGKARARFLHWLLVS
jgi:hypothetical protein